MSRIEKLIILLFAIWCLGCVYVLQNVNTNVPELFVYQNILMFFVSFLFGYFFHYEISKLNQNKPKDVAVEFKKEKVKDDLKKIEGIGPAIEKILVSNNIESYDDLAKAKVEDLKLILSNAGSFFQNHNPASWGQQATLLRDGKMEEFKKLTDELVAGVRMN